MKHVILTLGIFSLGFLTSCDNTTETSEAEEVQTEQVEKTEGEEHPEAEDHAHSHDDGEAIALNNGEKWLVNEEMKPFVHEGETFVKAYVESGDRKSTRLNSSHVRISYA